MPRRFSLPWLCRPGIDLGSGPDLLFFRAPAWGCAGKNPRVMEGHKKGARQQFGKGKTFSEQEVMKFILKLQPDTGCTGGECFRVEDLRQSWTRSDIHVTQPLNSRLAWPKEKVYFPWIFLLPMEGSRHPPRRNLELEWRFGAWVSPSQSLLSTGRMAACAFCISPSLREIPKGNEKMEKRLEVPPSLGFV